VYHDALRTIKEDFMIENFRYLAKCNMEINRTMISIMKGSDKNSYNSQTNGYYKSIGEILDHYYIADIIWLSTFKQVRESSIFTKQIFLKIPQWGERQFRDIETFSKGRYDLDLMIIDYMNEISGNDLQKEIFRITKTGEKITRLFWKALIHMFNHDTHHRGQISQILDELGIDNDYSNMIRIE
jgi:uncharacterized damage-inducible protein DinB